MHVWYYAIANVRFLLTFCNHDCCCLGTMCALALEVLCQYLIKMAWTTLA